MIASIPDAETIEITTDFKREDRQMSQLSHQAGPDTQHPDQASLKLLVKGFNLDMMERSLLDGAVRLSQRRPPRLELLSDSDGMSADIVLIDGRDLQALNWAAGQTWLDHKPVVWVDVPAVARGHISVRRPVRWPVLPVLLLRALESNPQRPASARAPALVVAGGWPILVVDDSLAVRAYLRSLLEPRGFSVTDVDNAEAGIETAATNTYTCILMDVLMPGIDGYEACRRIKAQGRSGSTPPIVMLTSKSSPFDRIRGKIAGCDAYLTKPIDTERLHEVLTRYVDVPKASFSESSARTDSRQPQMVSAFHQPMALKGTPS
jgi:twitching motility two-component system response regulator PilG